MLCSIFGAEKLFMLNFIKIEHTHKCYVEQQADPPKLTPTPQKKKNKVFAN